MFLLHRHTYKVGIPNLVQTAPHPSPQTHSLVWEGWRFRSPAPGPPEPSQCTRSVNGFMWPRPKALPARKDSLFSAWQMSAPPGVIRNQPGLVTLELTPPLSSCWTAHKSGRGVTLLAVGPGEGSGFKVMGSVPDLRPPLFRTYLYTHCSQPSLPRSVLILPPQFSVPRALLTAGPLMGQGQVARASSHT